MQSDQISTVRRFNRLVTQRVGALDDHFLGRDRPLGHSRVLYEIGRAGADLRDLRERLGLDSGYLSRVVQSLGAAGLVESSADPDDGRVRRVRLTAAGRAEVREMNRRSDRAAADILRPLAAPLRERLTAAMGEVERLLRASAVVIDIVDPGGAEARWCLERYFEELDRRFDGGFDPALGVQADDADLRPPRGAFLVAGVDGEWVACGSLRPISPKAAYLKRMWVADAMRGAGLGRRMLAALEHQARILGYRTISLETHRVLAEAIRLYRAAGYREIAPFNDEPYADHWFEKRLRR